jgi:GNAT superfamily N-acetyltransferase
LLNDEIVGTFELMIMDNLAHSGMPSGIVEDVVVRPGFRSQGIGKKMMQFALDECKKAGCYKMTLSSNIKRERAHKFYESLGFKKHGFSFQIDIDNNVYRRHLL